MRRLGFSGLLSAAGIVFGSIGLLLGSGSDGRASPIDFSAFSPILQTQFSCNNGLSGGATIGCGGNFGTVKAYQVDANTLGFDVKLSTSPDAEFHLASAQTFGLNILNPSGGVLSFGSTIGVDAGSWTSAIDPPGNPPAPQFDGFGRFVETLTCTDCQAGSTTVVSERLTFTIHDTIAIGLSNILFNVANSDSTGNVNKNIYFAANVWLDPTSGNTGVIGATETCGVTHACGQDTVVPLPGALPLFVGGLGLIGLLASRRKRKLQEFA